MKKSKPTQYALGLMVSGRTLCGTLVVAGADGPVIQRQFLRQRSARGAAPAAGMAVAVPELAEESTGSDFTIQFGDSNPGSGEIFLANEFGGLEARDDRAPGESGSHAAETFELELAEILEECHTAGYPDPAIAFCLGSTDVAQVTLQRVDDASKAAASPKDDRKTRRPARQGHADPRLAQLIEQYPANFDHERVAYVPMTPSEDGTARSLAFLVRPGDPVTATLDQFRRQKEQRMPTVRLLDTEVPVLLGLARAALLAGAGEGAEAPTGNTLVVRAGVEDTLVMFLQGLQLQFCEDMRSLTAFDSPETVCSRVLLQQDEYGIDEVHQVLLLSEDREADLAESFEMFFPEARVRSLRGLVASMGAGEATRTSAVVAATGAGLRLVEEEADRFFEDVNLLPKRYTRRPLTLPVSWPQLAVAALLFVTAFFFAARYVLMEREIDTYREKLRQYPPVLADTDPKVLQARIDSMQAAYAGYMHALDVLDTLLVGSDQWSRSLDRVSRVAAGVRGAWIESWHPSGAVVEITGNATGRDRVVALAERLDGDIQALAFSEIREWPVYSFTMTIPVPQELPEAVKYLRAQAQAPTAAAGQAVPVQPVAAH